LADDFTAKLDAYLDGELSTDEMKALDVHVRSCPSCAADVLSRVQLKRAVRSAGNRYQPTPEFRERISRQVGARPPQALAFRVWLTSAAVIALVLVGALLASYAGRQGQRRQQAFNEATDLHIAMLASPNPVDVVSTDRHTVKPWFQGKIPFTFNLPELQNSDFSLVGGRVAYLHQAPGAQLIYQVRKHYVSVFIFQEGMANGALGSFSGSRKHASFNLETWNEQGLRYIVVSDTNAEDIGKLAALLKAAART
jgi:anti-sigma factor RsiW